MSKKKAPALKGHPDFPDRYAKHVPEHWVPSAESMSKEDMEKAIVECEMALDASEKEAADDLKILQLKEDLKMYQEGYREVKKVQTSKIKFLLYLMNSRGYDVSTDQSDD